MKSLIGLSIIVSFLLVISISPSWGPAHVPIKKAQVCLKERIITVSEKAVDKLIANVDACQFPACDFNNIFFTGDPCSNEDTDGDGRCDLENPRDSAGGVTPSCPEGKY